MSPLAHVLVAAVRLYQLTISPMLGPVCRFYPSCSHYGVQALRTHGAIRGSGLTLWRVLRCNPWNPGGVDVVPPAAGAAGHTEHTDLTGHDEAPGVPAHAA